MILLLAKICGLLIILLLAGYSKMASYLNKSVTNWVFAARLICNSPGHFFFPLQREKKKKKKEICPS